MKTINSAAHFFHKHFLWLLLLAYASAAVTPGPGLFLRNLSFTHITLSPTSNLNINPSLLMLAFLLLNAGLGIKIQEVRHLLSKPNLPIIGFLANLLIPIILIFTLRALLGLWHDHDELQNLLTGLALIVAMPIAGSSTAWAQNANGNLSLSLGLILLSTIASPITTPITLHAFSFITTGDYSEDLQELSQQGTNIFMCLTVVLPALTGIMLHSILGEEKISKCRPLLKLTNFILLLALNYSNAASSLPEAFGKLDLDYLILILIITTLMCTIAFSSGWLISKIFNTNKSDMAALMFGLGMNNNGTGLVFAASALTDHPAVLLPLVFYTLIQQILAGAVDRIFFQNEA